MAVAVSSHTLPKVEQGLSCLPVTIINPKLDASSTIWEVFGVAFVSELPTNKSGLSAFLLIVVNEYATSGRSMD